MIKWAAQSRKDSGFTVVETLIVLAVTSGLFIISAIVIDGRQSKTDFQIGSRAIQQQIQQIINETASGYYPNNGDFTCTVPVTGNNVTIASGATGLGENSNCIFAGKAVVFDATNNNQGGYRVLSLAGRRATSSGDVRNPAEAWVTAIPSTDNAVKISNNLEFYRGKINTSAASWADEFAIAFMPSMANFSSGGNAVAGVQQIQLHTFTNSWSTNNVITDINTEASQPAPYPEATNGVLLCFSSGGTDQSALITVTSGQEVRLEIKSGKTCT